MSAKKVDTRQGFYEYVYLLTIPGWEPVAYVELEDAYDLAVIYFAFSDCACSVTLEEIGSALLKTAAQVRMLGRSTKDNLYAEVVYLQRVVLVRKVGA